MINLIHHTKAAICLLFVTIGLLLGLSVHSYYAQELLVCWLFFRLGPYFACCGDFRGHTRLVRGKIRYPLGKHGGASDTDSCPRFYRTSREAGATVGESRLRQYSTPAKAGTRTARWRRCDCSSSSSRQWPQHQETATFNAAACGCK